MRFEFDEYSLAAISATLRTLDMPNSQLRQIKPLYYLESLDTLNLRGNMIDDFENEVCPILQTMNSLRYLSLKGNPVTGIPKYRDQVVLLSRSVQELDDKDVTEHERKYLVSLISRKKVQGTVYNEIKRKKEAPKMGVEGNTVALHNAKPTDGLGDGAQILSFAEFC